MKFPIRRKVLLLTLILSLALVAASVLISYTLFSSRLRRDTMTLCLDSARSTAAEMSRTYSTFINTFRRLAENALNENREEITRMSLDPGVSAEEKRAFFDTLTAGVFPPRDGMGMSYEMLIFHNSYQSALAHLSTVAGAGSMQGGYVFYYDEEYDCFVYLMDSNSENSPGYHYPMSVERAETNVLYDIISQETPTARFEDDNCVSAYPIYDQELSDKVLAYVSYRCSVGTIVKSQRDFMLTGGLITLGVTLLLALVYFVFVDRFVARHISSLSRAAADFTGQLESQEDLHPVSGGVKTNDELGDLSDRLDLMQHKILEYVSSLAEKTAQEESMKAELNIASRIQLESLPKRGFSLPGVRLDSFIRPAREVGGDLYDYFMIDADHLFFVIADVSGKGVPAALFMMRGKELIKANAAAGKTVKEMAAAVNSELCKNNEEGLFITAFFGIYELSSRCLRYVRAGHEQPFLKRNGAVVQISEESNIVLGLFDAFDFSEDSLILQPGDSLLLFTDGLDEGINPANEAFGYDRIRAVLEKDGGNVLETLYRELNDFSEGTDQFDDVTMLLLSIDEKTEFVFTDPKFDDITVLCDAVSEKMSGFDPEKVSQLSMVCDEWMNNVISYAFENTAQPELKVDLSVNGDEASLLFEDNGSSFNPLLQQSVNVLENPMTRSPGGMGILFVKEFSDSVIYERLGGKNVLRIGKRMR